MFKKNAGKCGWYCLPLCSMMYDTLLFYSLCYLCLCVSSFGAFPVFPVSRPIPDFYAKIPDFYVDIPCYLWFYARWGGGGGGGGGPCVDRRRLRPRTRCNPGVKSNLPARFPVPGTSPAPVPAGDWGAKLRGSYVSRTLATAICNASVYPPP